VKLNLIGRVRNTRLSHANALLPLFEAVVNSIYAISESGKAESGRIDVFINREPSAQMEIAGTSPTQPVRTFTIRDNGMGFTSANYDSFCTSDSQLKIAQGGKGVGRFLWLKSFDHAEVDSIFRDPNGQHWRRKFHLRLTEDGISNESSEEIAPTFPQTNVRLVNFKAEYQYWSPRSAETIAKRMVEHCLEHFVLGICPTIVLHDEPDGTTHHLNEMYRSQVQNRLVTTLFKAKGKDFTLHHLKVGPDYQPQHRLYFCAHKRVVRHESLQGKVANLTGALLDDGNVRFVYAGYVSGEYLDDAVNNERTEFLLPKEDGLAQELGWDTLLATAAGEAGKYLQPYTEPVRLAKEERIREYVHRKAPQYRPILKHKTHTLDMIPPDLSDDKLDLELHRINLSYDTELHEKSFGILSQLQTEGAEAPNFEEQYQQFTSEWNELGMSKLANHVAHRKATLSILEASLKLQATGKYHLESTVHNLIFPLKKTSDDVAAAQMNLWVIDDRLAYHYYLASDITLKQLRKDILDTDSEERADLLIFNTPAAFINEGPPFSSVVLVEFKRPARNDYKDDENPISQVYGYVRTIKSGGAHDRGGRPLSVSSHMPFYAYIICDLTEKLVSQAENANFTRSPDELGYFGYNAQLSTYVEIISFHKLLGDAKKRNAFLFDQLGIL
jgi:hypothetical protein